MKLEGDLTGHKVTPRTDKDGALRQFLQITFTCDVTHKLGKMDFNTLVEMQQEPVTIEIEPFQTKIDLRTGEMK